MPQQVSLIAPLVAGLALAYVLGTLASRLRMPPLIGYIVAGLVVGPHTPGLVVEPGLAQALSEAGIILVMFGIGLNFSLRDLVSVPPVAIPGALLRVLAGVLLGLGLGVLLGWPLGGGLIFGLALSVASTVVVLKALRDRHLVDSDRGRIAIGWLSIENAVAVLGLILIPVLAGIWGAPVAVADDPFVNMAGRLLSMDLGIGGVVAVTVLKLAAFIGFMVVVGQRLIPAILDFTAHSGSRELSRLAVLTIAIAVAAGAAYLFGAGLALGAFLAGMILAESRLSHGAAEEVLPFRDAFAVLLFISLGMLFDPAVVLRDPLPLIATVLIILVGKSAAGFFAMIALGRPVGTSLAASAALAHIGAFAFILVALGVGLGLLDSAARDLVVAGAIVSIVLNPLLFWAAERLRPAIEARYGVVRAPRETARREPALGPTPEGADAEAPEEEVVHPTALTAHTVVIGHGSVGTIVAEGLRAAGRPFLVVEDDAGRAARARAAGLEVIEGNAAGLQVLGLANVANAHTVVMAIANTFEAAQAIRQCRKASDDVHIVARAHSDEEESYLVKAGANTVVLGERALGTAMLERAMRDRGAEAGVQAVAAAIFAPGAGPQPPEPQTPLRPAIDEVELARAIGAPTVPPVAPPPAIETPLVSEVVVEVEPGDIIHEPAPEPATGDLGSAPEAGTEKPVHETDKPREPATIAAVPFNTAEGEASGEADETGPAGGSDTPAKDTGKPG